MRPHEVSTWHSGQGEWMDAMRVLLIDDHAMLTEALATALRGYDDIHTVWHAPTDSAELEAVIRRLQPDVITVEVNTFGGGATELLQRLAAARPQCPRVVLTADQEVTHAVDAARAGADAWVPKEQSIAELVAVLRGAVRGESWFPPPLLGPVLRTLREDARGVNALHTLSSREQEVLSYMADGLNGARIAGKLGIAAETVRTHIRSILAKLEVHSRLEAVSIARAQGWTSTLPRAVVPLSRQRE